jgi:hypothetical protein
MNKIPFSLYFSLISGLHVLIFDPFHGKNEVRVNPYFTGRNVHEVLCLCKAGSG